MRFHREHHPNRRLFWRVYLHGFFLLFVVAAAVTVIGIALGRGGHSMAQATRFREVLETRDPALLEDPARLRTFLLEAAEQANVNVTVYRPEGTLLGTSVEPPLPRLEPALVDALGSDPMQVGGQRWMMVMPIRQQGALAAYAVAEWRGPGVRQLARGFLFLGGILVALAIASVPLVRAIVSPLERLTRAVRALGAGDLTVRSGIRRRDEVGELAVAFDEMAVRLERLVRNERELLANVSHELRTPLSRIRVALELAAEGDAARAQRYLAEIGSDLAELETLVEDVLTAARLDQRSDGFPLHRERVSVNDLVEAAARRFREAWPDRVLIVAPADADVQVNGDAVMLRRVLDNLLDNARKYSDAATGVTLGVRADAVRVQLEVRDEGIGLGEEDLRQLFTPFFRSDRSRVRGSGGVGLGLALARRIVDAHGGTISAESTPGAGTTFTVTLPRAEGSPHL